MAPNDKDLYIKQFLKLKKGTPLYQPCAVQVGDVGFIDPLDGFFQKLYNIDTPPRGEAGGPPPIQLNTTSHREQCNAYHLKKSKRFGFSSKVAIPKGQTEVVFSKVEEGECILIPGSVVVMERLEKTSSLSKYMEDHVNWIRRTFSGRDREGYQFSRESLKLVTRTVKTDRWAIAVNTSSDIVKNVSFNIASVGASLWGEWSTSSLISRSGPVPINGAWHPTGIEGADQTIFVRSIALRPPKSLLDGPIFRPSVTHSTAERVGATVGSVKRQFRCRGSRGTL
ncbi:hypothetical protein V8E52_004188, partial [Russula decolorans]